MKRLLLSLTLLAALPVLANATLFTQYEAVRKSFLASSFKDVQSGAKQLAAEARSAKQAEVAKQADAVAAAADLDAARVAFGALSTEMKKVHDAAAKGDRPAVYYCPMVRQSWLQPKGEVGNPYDAAMPTCGALQKE
ncbi:MAG TPA: hypothetical protein VEK57_22815 [Thermoanaerobaculia bacterium]|nr:hypothetical protein [Thermoanaerobaculia bacterium]